MEPSSILIDSDDASLSETNKAPRNNTTKHKEIISTLSQKNWHPCRKLHEYQGFWVGPVILEGIISAQEHFTPQPNDIIISSMPKSGTTWLKALCFAIITRTHLKNPFTNRLLTQLPRDIIPFIEHNSFHNNPNDQPFWSTHISYPSLPKSISQSNCKIIYICRNPKDVLISFWLFTLRDLEETSNDAFPLEKAFEKFCEGISPNGPYWDHALGYWKASLQSPEKILFIKYEDLQIDTLSSIKRIAEFIGCGFSVEEERQGLVQEVMELCSFSSLSNLEVNKGENYFSAPAFKIPHVSFFRKGKVGDWENYLTAEMASQLDEITEKKFSGSGLSFVSSTASWTSSQVDESDGT